MVDLIVELKKIIFKYLFLLKRFPSSYWKLSKRLNNYPYLNYVLLLVDHVLRIHSIRNFQLLLTFNQNKSFTLLINRQNSSISFQSFQTAQLNEHKTSSLLDNSISNHWQVNIKILNITNPLQIESFHKKTFKSGRPRINAAASSSSAEWREDNNRTVLSRFIYLWTFETFSLLFLSSLLYHFHEIPWFFFVCLILHILFFLLPFFLLRQIFIFTFNTSEDARQCCFFPFSLRIDLRTRPTKQHQCSCFANGTQCEYLMHRSFLSGFYKSI